MHFSSKMFACEKKSAYLCVVKNIINFLKNRKNEFKSAFYWKSWQGC